MNYWMPTVLFSCRDKTLVNNNLGREGFIWFTGYCPSLRKDVMGTWRQDGSRKHGGMLLAGFLLGFPPVTSLILSGPTYLVIVLPPVNWVMLRQLAIKKIPTETYPKANLTQAILWSRFLLPSYVCWQPRWAITFTIMTTHSKYKVSLMRKVEYSPWRYTKSQSLYWI